MYASDGRYVVLALDRAIYARILSHLRVIRQQDGDDAAYRRDLVGVYMALPLEELLTRLDRIIELLEQDITEPEPLDADVLAALTEIVTALGTAAA